VLPVNRASDAYCAVRFVLASSGWWRFLKFLSAQEYGGGSLSLEEESGSGCTEGGGLSWMLPMARVNPANLDLAMFQAQ
jgi:hypothetical protein